MRKKFHNPYKSITQAELAHKTSEYTYKGKDRVVEKEIQNINKLITQAELAHNHCSYESYKSAISLAESANSKAVSVMKRIDEMGKKEAEKKEHLSDLFATSVLVGALLFGIICALGCSVGGCITHFNENIWDSLAGALIGALGGGIVGAILGAIVGDIIMRLKR